MFEQEAPKTGTQKCSTKRGVREPFRVEFALKNREFVKAEVFEKGVFEQTTPSKWRNEAGIFLEQPFGKLFSRRSREGISFPNFVERSILKQGQCPSPSSVLCPSPYRALFGGERGRKGAEKRWVANNGGKKENRTREK